MTDNWEIKDVDNEMHQSIRRGHAIIVMLSSLCFLVIILVVKSADYILSHISSFHWPIHFPITLGWEAIIGVCTLILAIASLYVSYQMKLQTSISNEVAETRNIPDFGNRKTRLRLIYDKKKKRIVKIDVYITNIGGKAAYVDSVSIHLVYKGLVYNASKYIKKNINSGAETVVVFDKYVDLMSMSEEDLSKRYSDDENSEEKLLVWKRINLVYNRKKYDNLDEKGRINLFKAHTIALGLNIFLNNRLKQEKIMDSHKIGIIGVVFYNEGETANSQTSPYSKEIFIKDINPAKSIVDYLCLKVTPTKKS